MKNGIELIWMGKGAGKLKFSGAIDKKHGPILGNSGASMLHVTGAKEVSFYQC